MRIPPTFGNEDKKQREYKKFVSEFRDMTPAETRGMARAYIDRMGYDRITPKMVDAAARRLSEGRDKLRDDRSLARFVSSGAWAMPSKQLDKYSRGEPVAALDAKRLHDAARKLGKEHPRQRCLL